MEDVESSLQTTDPQARFDSCRWSRKADGDTAAHCAHAEVLPFAGRHGFTPDAWCPGCAFFKVKRKAARPADYR
jgi:hypothetical protein